MPKINDFCENYYEVELFDHDRRVDGFCEYGDIETIAGTMDCHLQDYDNWSDMKAIIYYCENARYHMVAVMPHLDEPECKIVMTDSEFDTFAHAIGTRRYQLKGFSTQELYNELYEREHVLPDMWVDDDVKHALAESGIEVTDENIDKVWKVLNNGHFMDAVIECGWSQLYSVIENVFNK